MKQILIILGLLASVTTFAQSPRIKLNQITKDTVKGSVLISSPSDSGMVYSRDFYIAYGADTVLILYGDTLGGVGGGFASVLTDGVTITGDGTTGNELTADTSVLATLRALSDSLALVISSVTADNVTITGDGTVGSPLKVDTATYIATKQDLNSYYLDSNPDGYTSNTGTVTSVGGTGTVNGISLSGTVTSSGNLTLGGTLSGVDLTSQVTGTLPVANGGTGSSSQNFVDLSNAQTVGGAKTFSTGIVVNEDGNNVDTRFEGDTEPNLLFLDASTNSIGIGTSSPNYKLDIAQSTDSSYAINIGNPSGRYAYIGYSDTYQLDFGVTGTNDDVRYGVFTVGSGGAKFFTSGSERMRITGGGNVGIGTTSPNYKLEVNGKVKISDLTGTGGNAVYENGGVLGVASDARFKSHIANLDNGIEKILNLKPKYFIDNRNSAFQQLGFYAQEVKSVINEASYPIGNTEYLGINDRAIIAVTVKAIQEQQAIIESQATEIEQLKSQIQLILSEIEQIKNN